MYLYGSFLTEDLLVDVIEMKKKRDKLHVYAYIAINTPLSVDKG